MLDIQSKIHVQPTKWPQAKIELYTQGVWIH